MNISDLLDKKRGPLFRKGLIKIPYYTSPDGQRYLYMGQGHKICMPFHLRWLLPCVLRNRIGGWILSSYLSLACLIPLTIWYLHLHHIPRVQAVIGAILVIGLPGVFKIARKCPVLVDISAMVWGLLSTCLWLAGWRIPSVLVAILAGCIRETTPVFISLWAWTPWPLLGLISPIIRWVFFKQGQDPLGPEFNYPNPVKTAILTRKGAWLSGELWLLSWGILLFGLTNMSWQLGLTLIIAYGQCFVATDNERLFQWAWPVLLLSAMQVIPLSWFWLLVPLHFMNPHKREL